MKRLTRSIWNNLTDGTTAVAPAARPRATPRPLALEPRLMFDAAAVTAAAEAVQHAEAPGTHAADAGHGAALADAAARLAQAGPAAVAHEQDKSTRHDLVFIDTGVKGWEALRDGVLPGTDVVLIDPARDGLTQMLAALQGRTGLDSIQVLSHGVEGQVYLGSLRLDTAAVGARAADLAQLGSSLAPGGDLLLFGCRVAGGTGQGFINALAAATGADVAASTDNTGGTGPGGGDWTLEASTGPIESRVALSAHTQQAFAGHLATLLVDSASDVNDDATIDSSLFNDEIDGDGLSLREALFWAQSGDTLLLHTSLQGQTIALSADVATGASVILDTDSSNGITIAGHSFTINGTLTVNAGTGDVVTIGSALLGGDLVKTGGGVLNLTNNTNGYATTLVSGGRVSVAGDAYLGSGAVTLDGGTLAVIGGAGGSDNIDNTLVLGTGGGTLNVGGGGGTFTLEWSGPVLGTGGWTKTGASSLIFSNTNNYAGTTTIIGGTLSVAGDSNLGTGDVVLSGGTLAITGTGVTIDNAVQLNGVATISNANAVTLSGDVTGSGGLSKSGAGTLTLSGSSNNASGTVEVTAGTLRIGDGANLGSSAAVTVDSGATLVIGQSAKTIGSLAGAGDVILNATLRMGADNSSTTFSGVISSVNANGIVKQGTGTFTLSGANTFTGSATVSDGTLALSGGSALVDTAQVYVASPGTLSLLNDETFATLNNVASAGGTVSLGANTLTLGSATSVTFSGSITGTGGLTKSGTGTLTLDGSNIYTGATSVAAGELVASGGFAISNSSAVTVASGATLRLNTSETIGSLAGAGTVALGTRTLTAGDNGTSTTFSGVLGTSGTTGGFIKSGSGTFTLSGSSNHVASVQARGGTLAADSGGTAGSTALGAGTVTLNGGRLSLTGSSGSIGNALVMQQAGTISVGSSKTLTGLVSGSGQLSLEGGGTLTLAHTGNAASFSGGIRITASTLAVAADNNLGAGTVTLNGGSLNVTGPATIDNTVYVSDNSNLYHTGALTLSGVVGGFSQLSVWDTGTVTLSNSGNTGFSGGLRVTDATVSVASGAALGTGTIQLNSGSLSVTGATTVANNIDVSDASSINTSAAVTFSGALGNGNQLTLGGTGTATLSGTSTYSGNATVSGGTLLVTGSLANIDTVTVGSGATLGGTGSIGGGGHGAVTVQSGGTLAPGAGGAGTLTLNHGLTLQSGATLAVDITGATAGTGYDQVIVTGAVDVSGATLTINSTGLVAAYTDTYVLIDNDASDAIVGSFSNLAHGDTQQASDGRALLLSMAGGTNSNDITLTALSAPPVTSGLDGDTVSCTPGQGPVLLDAGGNATLTDADGGDFNGGSLTVAITAQRVAGEDVLSIRDQGNGAGQIGVAGGNVSYGGVVIGTVTGGTGSSDLVISFNNHADPAAVQALIRNLRYENTNTSNPSTLARTVSITADDGVAGVSTDAHITVNVGSANHAPTANGIGAQSVDEDASFGFTVPAGAFSDADGDTLAYSAALGNGAPLPGWLHFDGGTGQFSGIPQNGDVGSLSIRVTATDSHNATASTGFTLTVKNSNDAPTAAPIAAQAATQGAPFSLTLPAGTFADVDAGDTLAWTATRADGSALPAWLSFDAATHRFSGTPGNGDVGSLSVRVTATDSAQASASSGFTLAVANVNDAPAAGAIAAQAGHEGEAFAFTLPTGTFTDVDAGDTLALKATLADGSALPAWLHFDAASGSFSGTPASANVGSLSVRVTATDAAQASANSDFTLTVAAAPPPGHHAPVLATPTGITLVDTAGADSFSAVGGQLSATGDAGSTLRYGIDGGSAGQTQIGGHAYDQQKTGTYGTLWLDSATGQYVYVPDNGAVNAAARTGQDVFALNVSDGAMKGGAALTVDINGVDDRPQGGVALAGTPQVGQALSATASLTDAEGVAGTTLRWQVQAADGTWADVAGATGGSFTPAEAQAGHAVRVVARVADAQGGVAEVASAGSATVQAAAPPVVVPPEVVNPVPPLPIPPNVNPSPPQTGSGLPDPGRVASNPSLLNPLPLTPNGGGIGYPTGLLPVGGLLTDNVSAAGQTFIGVREQLILPTLDLRPMLPPVVLVGSNTGNFASYSLSSSYMQELNKAGFQLSAAQADGQPLPTWLRFDAAKGTFDGIPPVGYKGTLQIRLVARDAQGRVETSTLNMEVQGRPLPSGAILPPEGGTGGSNSITKPQAGRTGLSEQLQAAKRPALADRLNERLASRATPPQTPRT